MSNIVLKGIPAIRKGEVDENLSPAPPLVALAGMRSMVHILATSHIKLPTFDSERALNEALDVYYSSLVEAFPTKFPANKHLKSVENTIRLIAIEFGFEEGTYVEE